MQDSQETSLNHLNFEIQTQTVTYTSEETSISKMSTCFKYNLPRYGTCKKIEKLVKK